MMKLFHSRKGTRFIFVTLLVMALIMTYALPMSVFAENESNLPLDSDTDILIQDDSDNENSIDENSGDVEPGIGEEDPTSSADEDDSIIDPVDEPTLIDPVDEPTFLDTNLNTSTNDEQPKYIDVEVPAVWIPIDPDTGEVYTYLTPLVTHPDGYPGGLSEVAEWQDIEVGGNFSFTLPEYNNQYVISYGGTLITHGGSQYEIYNFLYTSSLFFSDRFHKVVAQGYGTYALGGNSPVKKVVYGEFEDTQDFNGISGLHGMQKIPYLPNETIELYVAVRDATLSSADFVEEELKIIKPASIPDFIQDIRNNITEYTFTNIDEIDYNANPVALRKDTISGENADLSTIFLYKYDDNDRTKGAFLKENGDYLNLANQSEEWLGSLSLGTYEVVIPIYWQRFNSSLISAPDKFSRDRYKIDDTIHFTLIIENPLEMEVSAEGYTGVYDGAAHGITVNAPDAATVSYDVENSLTDVGETTVQYTVTQEGYATVTGSAVIKITPRPITITAASSSKTYDGTPLINDAYTYTPEGTDEGLLESLGHEIQDVTVTGSQITVGSSPNVATGGSIVAPIDKPVPMLMSDEGGQFVDITYNYSITYVDGLLTVNSSSGGGSSGGGGSPNPEDPVIIPDEEIPASPMPDPEVIEVVDEPIPAGPLPKTGGFPALALIGIGGLLAATGTGLKLRKKT
jgi:hypothetical protein